MTKHEQGVPDPLAALMDLESELCDLERDAKIADRLVVEAQDGSFKDNNDTELAAHAVFRLARAVTDFKASFFRVWEETKSQIEKREAEAAS